MPQYPFFCSSCRDGFDLTLSMQDDTSGPRACPKCKSDARRVFLPPAIFTETTVGDKFDSRHEDIHLENKRHIEQKLADDPNRTWVPGPDVPKRFQPDMDRVARLRDAKKAKAK